MDTWHLLFFFTPRMKGMLLLQGHLVDRHRWRTENTSTENTGPVRRKHVWEAGYPGLLQYTSDTPNQQKDEERQHNANGFPFQKEIPSYRVTEIEGRVKKKGENIISQEKRKGKKVYQHLFL